MTPHTIVVGRGLLGSSAAHHLALLGDRVTLVGPSEPRNRANHTGVFASHYDSGRISRVIDRDPFFAQIAIASIRRHADLESETGIGFHHPVGHLTVSPMHDYVDGLVQAAEFYGLDHDRLESNDLGIAFSELRFGEGMIGVHERATAGWMDPRQYIEAMTRSACARGGRWIDAEVVAIDAGSSQVQVKTERGVEQGDRVLIATGAFANRHSLVPVPVPFEVQEHTVVLAEVEPAVAAALVAMPSVIYKRSDEFGDSVYLMPPIRYPDRRWYLKIGQSTGYTMTNPEENLTPWFQDSGDPEIAGWLEDELRSLLPDVRLGAMHSESCVTTKSPTARPFIDRIGATPIHVLLAGHGQVAKSADELGRIAAARVVTGQVPGEYADIDFEIPRPS